MTGAGVKLTNYVQGYDINVFVVVAVYHHILVHCGGCGWGGRVVVLQPEGRQFDPQSSQKMLHAEVSLRKMLNPELCLIEQQSAANRCTVWMCVWLGECKTVL